MQNKSDPICFEAGEISPTVLNWFNEVKRLSLVLPKSESRIMASAGMAAEIGCPLPMVISLCPGITNLEEPSNKGQTRELVILRRDNPRLILFIKELFRLHCVSNETLGVPIEVMIVFADVLEKDANTMFTNVDRWQEIALLSAKEIAASFAIVDQMISGEFQKTKFKIPKIRLQSNVLEQAGRVGLRHEDELHKVELACFNPALPEFDLFVKHLKLTAETPFVATGFQTTKSAGAVWNRVRFMLAQCAADGVILPKMMEIMHKKSFPLRMPSPIFICSTTRLGGIELEMDGFSLSQENCGVLAIFKNIGSWTKQVDLLTGLTPPVGR